MKNASSPFHFQKIIFKNTWQDRIFSSRPRRRIYELKQPELDDAFAQGVGIEKLETLKTKLRENMQVEFMQKAQEAAEIELLENW